MATKKLTILHANDLHGQLQFTMGEDFVLRGGISLTSGYVKRVREEEEAVFFGICGDVLQEDILGSDYKGTNTVSLLNYLKPDALSLGNHELDYGLSHLLTFQSCIKAPVLCANMVVAPLEQPLFLPSMVYEVSGIRILLIGVIPKAFLNKILSDEFCRNMLSYKDTYDAIREEKKRHEGEHIDLTILMSHYGIEGDERLAAELPEDCRVDLILGGHSHINMDSALEFQGIPYAQSSYGTTHIGRFDLEVDTEKGGIASWKWERVELNEENTEFDLGVDELADRIVFEKKAVAGKETIAEFERVLENGSRLYVTELGALISDIFKDRFGTDLVILQSGSLRAKEAGPELTEKDLKTLYPFDDRFVTVKMSGRELRDAFDYLFSLKEDGSVMNGTFQYSKGFELTVDADDCWNKGCKVLSITLDGEPLSDEREYMIGMTRNCAESFLRYFGFVLSPERLRTVSFSTFNDLAEYFLASDDVIPAPETGGRFTFLNFAG